MCRRGVTSLHSNRMWVERDTMSVVTTATAPTVAESASAGLPVRRNTDEAIVSVGGLSLPVSLST
jgi:hypothetical protein